MTTKPWLTLPTRTGIESPGLEALLSQTGNHAQVWADCKKPHYLIELASAAGQPTQVVLNAARQGCLDAWTHWTGGATDPRPVQVLSALSMWTEGNASFDDIWATWELADHVMREVRVWHSGQQGAVLASAIVNAVAAMYSLVTVARDLAEPEPGHDQYDASRYAKKNKDPANLNLLHRARESVKLATEAGSFWHSHTEATGSADDHRHYANQVLGFVIRQHLPGPEVVHGLTRRGI